MQFCIQNNFINNISKCFGFFSKMGVHTLFVKCGICSKNVTLITCLLLHIRNQIKVLTDPDT